MFGKSNRQRLKEFKELLKNKNDSDIEQVFNDDNFSIADNFVAEDYIDFMDDFDNPDSNDLFDIRQQYEHVIDLQDFEEEEDAQNVFGNTNMTPLYDNAILSDVEFSMGIMALAREKHLSDATINDVLNVFRSILPESNKVPATYNKVKTIVETNSPYNLLQKNIIFCASCKKDICVCGQVDKSILLVFDVQLQLEELLSRYQDIMDKYRNDMLQQTDYMDIHQSVYYRNTLIKYPNMLPFAIYTDGGRYTHTGAFEGWPVVLFLLDLPPKLRYKYSNIIFAGYWYSKRKPDWQFIFEKLDRLLRFSFNGREYRMKYLQVVADIPARQNLLSMINVPGYNCCYNCNIKGQYSGHVFFPYAPPIPRDPRTFIDCTDGVKGESVLQERIESFPGGVVIDVMHSVYRGPIEDDIKRLIAGFRRDEAVWGLIKFNQATVTKLDEMMTF
uniref:Transposase n=1 Tax=Panagrolaimus davidi TaxID=227884 RepID=A0A914PQQ7_9BILA